MELFPETIWKALQAFQDPDTCMVYDYRLSVRQDPRENLPTAAQVRDDMPNQCGWTSCFEDCALNMSLALSHAVDYADHMQDEKWRKIAMQLGDAVLHLAGVSETPGFLARGVFPDGATHYRNSSVDQYTMVLWGLWRFWQWEHITSKCRRAIDDFMTNAVELLRRHDWDIPTEDEKPGWVGETSKLWPDRATRLLQIVLGAYAVSGRKEYLDLYRQLREENNRRRTRGIFCIPAYTMIPYAILQTQVSLCMLSGLDGDADARAIWKMHLHDVAEHAVRRLEQVKPDDLTQWIRELPKLHDGKGWSSAYTDRDYRDRHDCDRVLAGLSAVSVAQDEQAGDAGFVVRWNHSRQRSRLEAKALREPLELILTFLLAGSDDIVDVFGQPMRGVVEKYWQAIKEDVQPQELLNAHSALLLLCCAMHLEK